MNVPVSDPLPKVICFPADLSGVEVVARSRLLWPCLAYRVAVSATASRTMNIFERTVLRLAAAGHRNAGIIAERCGLHPDIVGFILSRLARYGYLDEHHKPLGDVDRILRGHGGPVEEKGGVVLVELLGGSTLPFILEGKPEFSDVEPRGEHRFHLPGHFPGETLRTLRWTHDPEKVRLTSKDVSDILRMPQHRPALASGRHAAMLKVSGHVEEVVVSPAPVRVFVQTTCIIQAGQFDPVLTDPFGQGFSTLLTRLYMSHLRTNESERTRMEGLYQRAHREEGGSPVPGAIRRSDRDLPYGDVRKRLSEADEHWRDARAPKTSAEAEKAVPQALANCLGELYASVEYALRHVVRQYPPAPGLERSLAAQRPNDNATLLAHMARRCGFQLNEPLPAVLRVAGGSVARAGDDGRVEFQSLLALALAGSDRLADHPLYGLGAHDPHWLDLMADLKRHRDAGSHGTVPTATAAPNQIDRFRDRVRAAVFRLLPELEDPGTGEAALDTTEAAANNQRLRARADVIRKLGLIGFYDSTPDVRNNLVALELALQERPEGKPVWDAAVPVRLMAGLIQNVLYGAARVGAPPADAVPPVAADEAKREALDRATQTGFTLEDGRFPRSIETVGAGRLRGALAGHSVSLGADLLMLLLRSAPDRLTEIATAKPDLIGFVARLCSLRGHGNATVLLSPEETGGLAQETYSVIRYFMETRSA